MNATLKIWLVFILKLLLFLIPVVSLIIYLRPFKQEGVFNFDQDFSILFNEQGTYCFVPGAAPACEAFPITNYKNRVPILNLFNIPPEYFAFEYCVYNTVVYPSDLHFDKDVIEVQVSNDENIKPNESKCFPFNLQNTDVINPIFSYYQCSEEYRPRGTLSSLPGKIHIRIDLQPKFQVVLPIFLFVVISGLWWESIFLVIKTWKFFKTKFQK